MKRPISDLDQPIKSDLGQPIKEKPKTEVEYWPIQKKYYPKIDGQYLVHWDSSDSYERRSYPEGSCKSKDREGALEYIHKYLEQLGAGVVIEEIKT